MPTRVGVRSLSGTVATVLMSLVPYYTLRCVSVYSVLFSKTVPLFFCELSISMFNILSEIKRAQRRIGILQINIALLAITELSINRIRNKL